jgi:hypothetical protein
MNRFSKKIKEKYAEVYTNAIQKFLMTKQDQYIFVEIDRDSLLITDIFYSKVNEQEPMDDSTIIMNTESVYNIEEELENVYQNQKAFIKHLDKEDYFTEVDSVIEDNLFFSNIN